MLKFFSYSADEFGEGLSGIRFQSYSEVFDSRIDMLIYLFPDTTCIMERRNEWKREKGTYIVDDKITYINIREPQFYL